jgi:hypothetical protein
MPNFINLKGQKFNRLLVVDIYDKNKSGSYRYICKCDCGKETIVQSSKLKIGWTKSCGCLQKEIVSAKGTKHKLCNHKLYGVFNSMKERCYNEKNIRFKNYGNRGVIICDEWRKDFKSFYDWAIDNGYKEGLQIDRIDVNGNYKPSNCRFISFKDNMNNTTRNVWIELDGIKKTAAQWGEKTNINGIAIAQRVREGKTGLEAIYGAKYKNKCLKK